MPVRRLCRLLEVHPSGYYARCNVPRSAREIEDERLTGLIKQFWLESGGIYGYRKIHRDLRDIGERCGKHRVRRLMRLAGLRAQVGYRRPRQKSGPAGLRALCRRHDPSPASPARYDARRRSRRCRRSSGGYPGSVLRHTALGHWEVSSASCRSHSARHRAPRTSTSPARSLDASQ